VLKIEEARDKAREIIKAIRAGVPAPTKPDSWKGSSDRLWPIATLPQDFMSAMTCKRTLPRRRE